MLEVVERNYKKRVFKIEVKNTIFDSDEDKKTCYYTVGMLAESAERILGSEIDCKEIECVNESEKNDRCVLEMKPAESFELGVDQG